MRPGRRVRAAPPQADLSPGTGRRRGPGTGCGCSALGPCLAADASVSAQCPRRSAPGSRRPPGPVPLPGAPERGQASAAGAGAPRGSRRHGGSYAPALPPPPSPSPSRAEPRGYPTCERVRGTGRRAAAGAGRRRPPARRKVPTAVRRLPPPRTSSPARSGWKSPAKPAALRAPPNYRGRARHSRSARRRQPGAGLVLAAGPDCT